MNICWRLFILWLLVLIAGVSIVESRFVQPAQMCRNRPDVVGKCFSVHGRLSVYNGTPSVRLWPMGTKRLLGVIDPTDVSHEPGPSVLPLDIKSRLDWDKKVIGDFVVCPLTKLRPDRMQAVCIQSGKNLVVKPHKLNGN